jgi:hypothetical protein
VKALWSTLLRAEVSKLDPIIRAPSAGRQLGRNPNAITWSIILWPSDVL